MLSFLFILIPIGIIYLISPNLSKTIIKFIITKLVNSITNIFNLYLLYCLTIYFLYQYYIINIILKEQSLQYDIINGILFALLIFHAILLTENNSSYKYCTSVCYNNSFCFLIIIWFGYMTFKVVFFLFEESSNTLMKTGGNTIKLLKFGFTTSFIPSALLSLIMLPAGIWSISLSFLINMLSYNFTFFGRFAYDLYSIDNKLKATIDIVREDLNKKQIYFLVYYIFFYLINILVLLIILLIINPTIKLYLNFKEFSKNEKESHKIKKLN